MSDKDLQEVNTFQTRRATSEGAERWLYEKVSVLDHGHVMLVDYMGNDLSIEEAARVSYGQGTRRLSQTEGLIRYLRRHDHTTPFEMVELKFACKMPYFVARQWIRHRTASVNEYSARYSEVEDVFYVPEDEAIQLQSTDNKQGRGDLAAELTRQQFPEYLRSVAEEAHLHYSEMLDQGLARELARVILPLSFYTEWYWKINLHNLMHFLRLRLDSHAQMEIRVYAEAMAKIAAEAFPIAWQAFVDYELESIKMTRLDMEVLRTSAAQIGPTRLAEALSQAGLTNQRERWESIEKLHGLGLLRPGTRIDWEEYAAALELTGKQFARELKMLESLSLVFL